MADVGNVQQGHDQRSAVVIQHGNASAARAREGNVVRCLYVQHPTA